MSPKPAEFIKKKRKDLGLTQEELAKRIGVGLRFIRELEQGKALYVWINSTKFLTILERSWCHQE